jgi:hypothetical protein
MLKPTQLHRVRCLENGCVYQMLAISDLRNHLANHHLKPEYKTTEEKKFNSFVGKICTRDFLFRRGKHDMYGFKFL